MKNSKRPLICASKGLIVLGALALAASCTAQAPADLSDPATDQTPEPAEPTTVTVLGEPEPATIAAGELVGEAEIVLTVEHGACDELEGWSAEESGSVTIGVRQRAIQTVSDDPDITYACGDVGLVDEITIKLDQPLGDQDLSILQSSASWVDRNGFCLLDASWCRPFDLVVGDTTVRVAEQAAINPVDITFGTASPTVLTVGGVLIEVETTTRLAEPTLMTHQTIGRIEPQAWGNVRIHNRERSLELAEPAGRTVGGHEAWLLRYAGDPAGTLPTVGIDLGSWWVDVSVFAADPAANEAAMTEVLDGLRIELVDGDLPNVVLPDGWLGAGFTELTVVDKGVGFGLSIDPNCEPATEVRCTRDLGFVWPTYSPGERLPGDPEEFGIVGTETSLPEGLSIQISDMGPRGELIACDGVPAFDVALLPAGVSLDEATSTTEIFTGLTNWQQRIQPGTETWFSGDPGAPSAVARYERDGADTWQTVSVTSCQ